MENRRTARSVTSALLKVACVIMLVAAPLTPATAENVSTSVVGPQQAIAMNCEPPFNTLPGCTGSGTGGGTGGGTTDPSTPGTSGTWSTQSLAGMTVELYTPTSTPRFNIKRVLMISLHGCAQTSTVLKNGANWQSTADEYGMVVAIPAAPNGGVVMGCWDHYDANDNRTSRHDDDLIDLAKALTAQAGLNIDAQQVYVSGLSSGAGESMVMGCLAPDIFAGVGINSGPTIGTSSSQIGSVSTNLASAKSLCTKFAGTNTTHLSTQLTSIIYGSKDSLVAPGYNTLNASVMSELYSATTQSAFSLTSLAGSNTNGSGTLYSDSQGPRVSLIQSTGLGHNWPAGGGSGGS